MCKQDRTINEYFEENAFFSKLCGSLRESLSVMKMAMDLYGNHAGMERILPESDRKYVSIALHSYHKILRLVSNIDAFLRLSDPSFAPERSILDACTVCRDIVQSVNCLTPPDTPRITFSSSTEDAYISINQELFLLLLLSPISNSLKFTPADGSISVSVSATENRVIISVRDSGRGMPAIALASAFDHPKRLKDLSDASEGLGLGLPLACKIAEFFGGSMILESGDSGTTFTAVLPPARGDEGVVSSQHTDYNDNSMSYLLSGLSEVLDSDTYSPRFSD